METRRGALKKRKAEEHMENELVQKQMFNNLNKKSSEIGSRYIEIAPEVKCSVSIDDTLNKQETIVELETVGEFCSTPSEVKIEIEEQKFVVVNEEKIICNDVSYSDMNSAVETSGNVDSCDELNYSDDLQIKVEPELLNIEDVQHQNANLEKGLPLIVDHLKLNNILLCREVSKKWREIVDCFLHSKITRQPFDNETYLMQMKKFPFGEISRQKYLRIKYAYHFKSNVDMFTETMKEHVSLDLSPFVGGARVSFANEPVLLNGREIRNIKKYFGRVQNLIKLFGKHVSSLRIEDPGAGDNGRPSITFKDTILKCLDTCPNLKTLALKYKPSDAVDLSRVDVLSSWNKSFKPKPSSLSKNLNSFSLKIDESNYGTLSGLLINNLIKPFYKTQLKKLTIFSDKLNLKSELPQLRELTLLLDFATTKTELENILMGKWLVAPIEKIYFKTDAVLDISITYLLNMLQKFPTVQYLRLDHDIWVETNFINHKKFQLHCIHTLELANFFGEDEVPYYFFRVFPKLRYLKVHISRMMNIGKHTVLHFQDFVPVKFFFGTGISIYDTRIWEIATDLDVVVIQWHRHKCGQPAKCERWSTELCPIQNVIGTRQGYRRHCEDLAVIATD